MSSITGLGLRNKVGLGKKDSAPSTPKPQGSSITGLGLRNKAAGLTGSKKGHELDARDRTSTPLSSLRDPASFAPPPRHVNLSAPVERQSDAVARKGPLTPAEYRAREDEKLRREKEEETRERELRKWEREEKLRLKAEERGEAAGYSNDSTGLSTKQFAPPVARAVASDGTVVIRASAQKPKPNLPPRLPDRKNSSSTTESNGAVGGSSISVSSQAQSPTEYGIPKLPARSSTGSSSRSLGSAAPPPENSNPQLSELQSRFARMKTTSPTTESFPKQGGRYGGPARCGESPRESMHEDDIESPILMQDNTVAPVKKAPPPVPRKRAALSGSPTAGGGEALPPIPLASKPSFR